DHFQIPISDKDLEENPKLPPYYHPGVDAPEIKYLQERRAELGGYSPERRTTYVDLKMPSDKAFEAGRRGSGKQSIATTMGLVRVLKVLMREKEFGHWIGRHIACDARSFG